MEQQNVTLTIPKDVLDKAKALAVEQNMSLSTLLTKLLSDAVTRADQFVLAQKRHLAWLEQGVNLGTKGQMDQPRQELHQR